MQERAHADVARTVAEAQQRALDDVLAAAPPPMSEVMSLSTSSRIGSSDCSCAISSD